MLGPCAGPPAPLSERNFRLLFTAQAVWLLGSWMTPVALAFAVLEQTTSPTALGLVLGAETVPLALLLLVGGVWADRLSRVRVMVVADLVSFASQGVLAALIISGRAEIWQMAVLSAVGGAADAFHTPAWAGLLPQTVPASLLQQANALRHLESNAARVVSPLVAGVIVSTAGAGYAIAADAVSFLVAAAILVRIRVEDVRGATRAAGRFRVQLAEGWEVVRSRSWLLAMMVDTGLWMLMVYAPYEVLGPLVAKQHLERVPGEAMARVASFERLAVYAPLPLGMAVTGPVAGAIGVSSTLWLAAGWLGVSTVFLLAIPSVRALERLDAAPA